LYETIDFSLIPPLNEKTNFNSILKFIEVFSQLNKIGNPKCIETNFNKLISTFNISNYDALITLKEYFSNFYYQKVSFINKKIFLMQ